MPTKMVCCFDCYPHQRDLPNYRNNPCDRHMVYMTQPQLKHCIEQLLDRVKHLERVVPTMKLTDFGEMVVEAQERKAVGAPEPLTFSKFSEMVREEREKELREGRAAIDKSGELDERLCRVVNDLNVERTAVKERDREIADLKARLEQVVLTTARKNKEIKSLSITGGELWAWRKEAVELQEELRFELEEETRRADRSEEQRLASEAARLEVTQRADALAGANIARSDENARLQKELGEARAEVRETRARAISVGEAAAAHLTHLNSARNLQRDSRDLAERYSARLVKHHAKLPEGQECLPCAEADKEGGW